MTKKILTFLSLIFILSVFTGTAYAAPKTASPPRTREAIVLDCDRAILLADYPANKGIKIKSKGFLLGTSESTINMKYASGPIQRGCMNVLTTGLQPETQYYYKAFITTSSGTYFGDTVSFTTPSGKEWAPGDTALQTSDERYKLIFGLTDKYYKVSSPPWGYNGVAEAKKSIVTVTVNTWSLVKGKKVSKPRTLQVHYKLAANVKAIFDEIYKLDIQFPVITMKGYYYRRMVVPWIKNNPYLSQHSYGTCIDINKQYNLFYRSKDKRNKQSPYCTPVSVIKIFEKYGWTWGGNFKEGLDTMHFQYLGPELMK